MTDFAAIVAEAERELTAGACRLIGAGRHVEAGVMLGLELGPDKVRIAVELLGRLGCVRGLADLIRRSDAERAGTPGAGRIDPACN